MHFRKSAHPPQPHGDVTRGTDTRYHENHRNLPEPFYYVAEWPHHSNSFSRRMKHILAGRCKQRAKYTLTVFWRLNSNFFFCCCSTGVLETWHGKRNIRKKGTIWNLEQKELDRYCLHSAECYHESKQVGEGEGGFPLHEPPYPLLSLYLSVSCTLVHAVLCCREPVASGGEEVRLCVGGGGGGGGGGACVAMETPRYQLYQPPCLTQIFFFFPPRHPPPSDYKCFSPAPPGTLPHTDSVMVQSEPPHPIRQ